MTQPSDGDLLKRFREQADQEAFAALMERHGRMVLVAARSVLRESGGAEDVLQATFLTLAKKAGSLSGEKSLAGWLYYVAVCLARDERKKEQRHRVREKEAAMIAAMHDDEQMLNADGRAMLYEELGNLAERDRVPVLLHHLEGKSYEDAADELGLNPKTFSARLTRAREKLRKRLAGRGVALGGTAMVAALGKNVAAAEVPATVVASTTEAASLIAAGKAVTGGVLSAKVIALTEGAINMLFWTKVKIVTVVCAAAVMLGVSVPVGVAVLTAGEEDAPKAATPGPTVVPAPAQQEPAIAFRVHADDAVACAQAYRKAFELLEELPAGWSETARAIVEGKARPAQVDIEPWLPIYNKALAAAAHKNVDWQRRSNGPEIQLPELGQIRNLAHLALAVGRYRLEQNDPRGLEAWLAAWMMARHAGQDGPLAAFLVQTSIHKHMMECLSHTAIAIQSLHLGSFADHLAALPSAVPLEEALKNEKAQMHDWLAAEFGRAVKAGKPDVEAFVKRMQQAGVPLAGKSHKEIEGVFQSHSRNVEAYFKGIVALTKLPPQEQEEAMRALDENVKANTDRAMQVLMPSLNRSVMAAQMDTAVRPLLLAVCRAAATDKAEPLPEVRNPITGKPIKLERTSTGVKGTVPSPWPKMTPLVLRIGEDTTAQKEEIF